MRLLLDTTYVLPAIGVAINGLPTDVPVRHACILGPWSMSLAFWYSIVFDY
jgi:hypothetical protein